MIIFPGSWQPR